MHFYWKYENTCITNAKIILVSYVVNRFQAAFFYFFISLVSSNHWNCNIKSYHIKFNDTKHLNRKSFLKRWENCIALNDMQHYKTMEVKHECRGMNAYNLCASNLVLVLFQFEWIKWFIGSVCCRSKVIKMIIYWFPCLFLLFN